jgi:CRISPR-associated protein Cas1
MAWRGLHLSNPARLTLADQQCVVGQESGETRLPLRDIAWIVLDTPQATLTTALASAAMEHGIAIIITDARHHPCGVLLPFHQHYRQAEVAAIQVNTAEPVRGALWQLLVRGKIEAQAALLRHAHRKFAPLAAMVRHVQPGDPTNIEARAARHYWGELFPDFTRSNESDLRNAMLNYGYAVLRAAVARGLTAAGLLPALGLHHASNLNPFNLADDVIEPFRPVVDQLVWRMSMQQQGSAGQLTVHHRQTLAGLLLQPVQLGADQVTCLAATEMVATSLVRALETASPAALLIPRLLADSQ